MSNNDNDGIDLAKGAENMGSITNTPFAIGKLCLGAFGLVFKIAGIMLGAIFSQK